MAKVRKVRIKKTTNISQMDANELSKITSQLFGMEDAEKRILFPKCVKMDICIIEYCNIIANISKIYKNVINDKVLNDKLCEFDNYVTSCRKEFNIDKYCNKKDIKINNQVQTISDIDKKYNDYINKVTNNKFNNMDNKRINEYYNEFKKSKNIRLLIKTSNDLSKYKGFLNNTDNLKDNFIKKKLDCLSDVFCPFAFNKDFDILQLWLDEKFSKSSKYKNNMLNILSKSFTSGLLLYNILTTPNIDIDHFSEMFVDVLMSIKNHIPRCNEAFKAIENSVFVTKGYLDSNLNEAVLEEIKNFYKP